MLSFLSNFVENCKFNDGRAGEIIIQRELVGTFSIGSAAKFRIYKRPDVLRLAIEMLPPIPAVIECNRASPS